MKISELESMLKKAREKHGDIETTFQATLLPDGYSASNSELIADVFESTIESSYVRHDGELGTRLHIQWQC